MTTRDELLARYANGERLFASSELDEGDFNFDNCSLPGIDLSGSFVVASFRGADLSGANFSRSNVKTSDFSGANLSGALFVEAAIDAAVFDGANLDGAVFRGASAYGYTFGANERPDTIAGG